MRVNKFTNPGRPLSGHNSARELGLIAAAVRRGLEMVRAGEDTTIEGWLAYGAALKLGRERFASNEQFGQWVSGNLPLTELFQRASIGSHLMNYLKFQIFYLNLEFQI